MQVAIDVRFLLDVTLCALDVTQCALDLHQILLGSDMLSNDASIILS